MSNFIARVELHNATYADYEVLHASMQNRGYVKTIISGDGSVYDLPTGTYDVANTNASLQQAFDAAQAGAQQTRKSFSLIVAERSGAHWIGLPKIT